MISEAFITCAVTGAGDTVGRSSRVPVTPDQIAESAIDAARSEIGPILGGELLSPTTNPQVLSTSTTTTGPIRDPNAVLNSGLLTLPGTPGQTFVNEFVPVLQGSSTTAYVVPATLPGAYAYTPISGERDILGNLRQDDPAVPNVGFGSRPYFDIGAFEFRQFFPPEVVPVSTSQDVVATLPDGSTRDLYSTSTIAGLNQSPQSIEFKFSHQLDTTTINDQTVLLVGSGGDGIFGNANDVSFSLAGNRLTYDPSTQTLTINTAAMSAGLYLALFYVKHSIDRADGVALVAIYFILLKLALVVSLALLFSCYTTPLLAILFTGGLYVAGLFVKEMRRLHSDTLAPAAQTLLGWMSYVLPNFENFDVMASAAHGRHIPGALIAQNTAYAALYCTIVLASAITIFSRRDMK